MGGLVLLVLLTAIIPSAVFAWLEQTDTGSDETEINNAAVSLTYSLDDGATYSPFSGNENVTDYGGNTYSVRTDVIASTAEYYVDKVSVRATVQSKMDIAFRVKVYFVWEERTVAGEYVSIVQPRNMITLDYGADFHNSVTKDSTLYYKAGNDAKLNTGGAAVNLNVFTGVSGEVPVYEDNTYLKLFFEIEAVQYNRALEVWGLTAWPW